MTEPGSRMTSFGYGGENGLIQSQTGTSGTIVKYVYDALSRRVAKTTGGTSTYWCYDGWNPVTKYSGTEHTTGTPPALTFQESLLWGLDLSGTLQVAGGVGGLLSVNDYLMPLYDGNGNVVEHYTHVDGYAANRRMFGII